MVLATYKSYRRCHWFIEVAIVSEKHVIVSEKLSTSFHRWYHRKSHLIYNICFFLSASEWTAFGKGSCHWLKHKRTKSQRT